MEYILREQQLPTYYAQAFVTEPNIPLRKSGVSLLNSAAIHALHYHHTFEIGICFSGAGETHIDNRIYRHRKNCLEIVPPYHPHLSNSDKDNSSQWCWIFFDPQQILFDAGITDPETSLELIRNASKVSGVFDTEEFPVLTAAVQDLYAELTTKDNYSSLSIAFAIGKLLILLARSPKESYSDIPHDTAYQSILPATEYISSNLDEKEGISEPSLAELCHMSVSNLRRLFKLCTGLSPKAYIIRSRMAYAEYLLRKTDLTVLEISFRTGYGELSGFNRVFVKHFGISPGKYRRKYK